MAYLIKTFEKLKVKGLNKSSFEQAVAMCMLDMPNTLFGLDDVPRKKDLVKAFITADNDRVSVNSRVVLGLR
jgi:hypothetical protein